MHFIYSKYSQKFSIFSGILSREKSIEYVIFFVWAERKMASNTFAGTLLLRVFLNLVFAFVSTKNIIFKHIRMKFARICDKTPESSTMKHELMYFKWVTQLAMVVEKVRSDCTFCAYTDGHGKISITLTYTQQIAFVVKCVCNGVRQQMSHGILIIRFLVVCCQSNKMQEMFSRKIWLFLKIIVGDFFRNMTVSRFQRGTSVERTVTYICYYNAHSRTFYTSISFSVDIRILLDISLSHLY